MEKKKSDIYSAGYSSPEPFEIGRWYEKLSQEELDEFCRKEIEQRRQWAEKKSKEIIQDEDDGFMGDVLYIFSMLRGDT